MMVEYVWVRIGGGPEAVQQLLDGLPGDHQAEQVPGVDRYCVASNDAGFLRFAILNQGYGEVLDDEDTREASMSRHPTALDPVVYPPDEPGEGATARGEWLRAGVLPVGGLDDETPDDEPDDPKTAQSAEDWAEAEAWSRGERPVAERYVDLIDDERPLTSEEFAAGVRAALLADVLDEDERHDLMGPDLYDPKARADWDAG